MKKKYCIKCGSIMKSISEQSGYNENTGKPSFYKTYKCPNDNYLNLLPFGKHSKPDYGGAMD